MKIVTLKFLLQAVKTVKAPTPNNESESCDSRRWRCARRMWPAGCSIRNYLRICNRNFISATEVACFGEWIESNSPSAGKCRVYRIGKPLCCIGNTPTLNS